MSEYRWIIYMHNPLGGFDVDRVTSLDAAKSALVEYCKNTGFHADLQVTGEYGCTATLYAYDPARWLTALNFRDAGCPFDYPDRLVKRGPRGGTRVESC